MQSLVFGLLRQRKLDFLDIYSEEMVRAPRTSFDRYGTCPTHETEIRAEVTVLSLSPLQCVVKSVSQISEIDADAVK